MVGWFGTCRGRVETSDHGTALRARREGRRGQEEESNAEARGTRRVKGAREAQPSIPEKEGMAEQGREVSRGGAISHVIRVEREARVRLLRQGRDGHGGAKSGL